MLYGQTNVPIELTLTAARPYADVFNEIEVDVIWQAPSGEERIVPAFWVGGSIFRARYASAEPGRHRYRTVCSNPQDAGLHGQTGELELAPYAGEHALYRHGRLRVAASRRTLEHRDGTPFFWLGDTWWYGLVQRLEWPQGFHTLVEDRVAKGFSLIQIVAGPLCDFDAEHDPWNPQQANEAGLSWEPGWARINPRYYDLADLRIAYLVERGLVPCIVSMWGYFLPYLGVRKVKQHWRNLVARYGAYPVIWCLAGEVTMPTYSHIPLGGGSQDTTAESAALAAGWTEVARYLRAVDPYHNPLCAHPWNPVSGRLALRDETLLDIDMLQTGHGGYPTLGFTVEQVAAAAARAPRMPVIDGEVNYEGIMGGSWQEVQRAAFWMCVTAGAAGHTYGAQGIWQMNSRSGPPHDGNTGSWGSGFWQDAMNLPGSAQVGLGRRFLERYPWWLFEPRPEPALPEGRLAPCATGIPGALAIYYLPVNCIEDRLRGVDRGPFDGQFPRVTVEPGAHYQAYFFDPRTGADVPIGPVEPAGDGTWLVPRKPSMEDWVLVLEDKEALASLTTFPISATLAPIE